jgi:hypothetical protein
MVPAREARLRTAFAATSTVAITIIEKRPRSVIREGLKDMKVVIARSQFALLLAALLGLSGCSGADRPKTYAVEGQVAYNGKPLEGATVSFWAETSPRAAVGTTNAEGKFTLSTFELEDGAIAGLHKVTVTKLTEAELAAAAKMPAAPNDPSQMTQMTKMYRDKMDSMSQKGKKEKLAVPGKYSSASTTPLEAEVKASGNEPFVFQLTD